MILKEVEEIGLTKLVYIPFHNQQAGIVRLIRHFGDLYINVLKHYIEQFNTNVSFYVDPGQPKDNSHLSWDVFYEYIQGLSNKFIDTRLVHLKPVDFQIDEEGLVSLVCEYESKGLDKYIPEHVKGIYNNPVGLVDELINGKEPESGLWDFTPIAFVVPCFGEHVMNDQSMAQGLLTLASNATVNLPTLWKPAEDENFEFSLRMHSSIFDRQREVASKLNVLKPLIYDPLAMLILPNILSLPFLNHEEKESIEREAKIVTEFWIGKT